MMSASAKERRSLLGGSDLSLTATITDYIETTGRGTLVFVSSGGTWGFRPEIDDEVILGVTISGRADFKSPDGQHARLTSITGTAFVTLLSGKLEFEFSQLLLTRPGERSFFFDDIIIGATGSFEVHGLLIPAVY